VPCSGRFAKLALPGNRVRDAVCDQTSVCQLVGIVNMRHEFGTALWINAETTSHRWFPHAAKRGVSALVEIEGTTGGRQHRRRRRRRRRRR